MKNWPESERPRERLLRHGAENLSDAHLLAIILRTGSGEGGVLSLALSLLERFHTLRSIDTASLAELSVLKGLGTAKIAQLKAAFELGKRLMSESSEGKPSFSSSHALYTYFAPRFKNLKKEYFIGVLLDAKNRLLRECKISEGTLTNSLIHPREAFKEAVKESAASVIFVHNHPSGDPAPSRDDLAVTERLKNAGEIMGIPVLDHVIIGDGRYVSLKEKGIV
ncbi:MAG: DNA repair protein RadC [Alphaproteobacteria bacterium]|uniref:DNA repair protein RadC n=1 Tax=Candidatus Nitrobium versatile TaxID=2884831 RepID=A0A953J6P7_9BACT|nr:DNA repair protein RadC [Candidatus Nitrobium versatile]